MIKNKIREYRARDEITQEELADRVGVTRQTILAIEKGKYYPSLKLAFDIAQVFNMGIEKVFYIKERKTYEG